MLSRQLLGQSKCMDMNFFVLGDPGVGKSCFISQFVDEPGLSGDGEITYEKTVEIAGKTQYLTISEIESIQLANIDMYYYVGRQISMILYDITNRTSFENVDTYVKLCRESCLNHLQCEYTVLVGTKADLKSERQVTTEEVKEYAARENVFFYSQHEVCSHEHHGIQIIMDELLSDIFVHGVWVERIFFGVGHDMCLIPNPEPPSPPLVTIPYQEEMLRHAATELLNDSMHHDVLIQSASPDTNSFPAHRFILHSKSGYFRDVLESCEESLPTLEVKGSNSSLQKVKEWMYIGDVKMNQDVSDLDDVEKLLGVTIPRQVNCDEKNEKDISDEVKEGKQPKIENTHAIPSGSCTSLFNDLWKMAQDRLYTDFSIASKSKPEEKIAVHSAVLCARCHYFSAMLNKSSNFAESTSHEIQLDIIPDILKPVICFIYTADETENAAQLLVVCDEYALGERLSFLCQKKLAAQISSQTLISLYEICNVCQADDLKNHIMHFILTDCLENISSKEESVISGHLAKLLGVSNEGIDPLHVSSVIEWIEGKKWRGDKRLQIDKEEQYRMHFPKRRTTALFTFKIDWFGKERRKKENFRAAFKMMPYNNKIPTLWRKKD